MIEINKDIISKCASSLMFDLTPEATDLIYHEFDSVLAQIELLKSLPGVDQAEPMTFPYKDHQKLMREDKPSRPLKAKDALLNSSTKLGDQFKLPKVVGNNND